MPYKLLCIDESGLTRLELSRRLKDLDIAVVNAKDGIAVQNALELNYFSAFVCAVNSEGFRELDYVNQVKLRPEYRDTPIIVISRFTDRKFILKAVELGVQEYIAKPYDDEMLATRIASVLSAQPVKPGIEEDIIIFNFIEMFNREVKAASRGCYPMSVMFGTIVSQLSYKQDDNELEEIIKNLYKVIKTKLRDTDSIFLYGDGKLAMILPFADQAGVGVVQDKIKAVFDSHAVLRPFSYEFEFVAGSASFPEDGKIQQKLIEKAKSRLDVNIGSVRQRISEANVYA